MEEIKTQAIVLKAIDYKDGGKLLTLFSLEHGLILAKIRGVAKPKAKLAFASQPFCFGEFILASKVGFTVVNCTAIENFYTLSSDFDKFIAGSGILELVSLLVKEEASAELFVEVLKALKSLEFTDSMPLAIFIKFFINSMRLAGYKMQLDNCPVCGSTGAIKERFSFSYGARMCAICADSNSIALSSGESAILKLINENSYEKLQKIKFLSIDNLVTIAKILTKYFEDKTGEELKGIKDYL